MIQQLTKQDHYDYGLRSLKAVLNAAGALKRDTSLNMTEEAILLRALRDMNVPKFITDDLRLFKLLLGDLFPDLELADPDYGILQVAIERSLRSGLEGIADGVPLQCTDFIVGKTIQLYESMEMRHCNMMVGLTLSGKSTAWRCLAQTRTTLAKEKVGDFMPVRPIILNPKSLNLNEIYGAYDLATFEWMDGVLSSLFRDAAICEKPIEKWILLDGPVDTLWIESMNSVMDDNKVLTLINSDRIEMSNTMSLLFEVRDLAVASPATVSRAGMVYMDQASLGPKPFIKSWLDQYFYDPNAKKKVEISKKEDKENKESDSGTGTKDSSPEDENPDKVFLRELFEKYITPMIEAKESPEVNELVPISTFNSVQSFCGLFSTFSKDEKTGIAKEFKPSSMDDTQHQAYIEKWFCFCIVWSILAAADRPSRKRLDYLMRDIDSTFPAPNTIYDYYVDTKSGK
tara:strand:- start:132 stop:1502 length:1371 start_codon:yes stop_codon:yes gene_type:complete